MLTSSANASDELLLDEDTNLRLAHHLAPVWWLAHKFAYLVNWHDIGSSLEWWSAILEKAKGDVTLPASFSLTADADQAQVGLP